MNHLLNYYAKLWQHSLHMERTVGRQLRMPFSFPDIDRFGEALFGLHFDLKGSGTKGSGADLVPARANFQDEVKTVNLCQPSRCNKCNRRSPWSDVLCAHCGSTDLKKMSDSRFGISASAHQKDVSTIRQYDLIAIEHVDADTFRATAWVIDAKDPYFTTYVEEQAKQTSKTCNLLPRSFDFMMSGAKQVLQVDMTLPQDITKEPTVGEINRKEVIEDIPWSLLNAAEREALGLTKDQTVTVEHAKKVLVARKKAHGKARGETSRHVVCADSE